MAALGAAAAVWPLDIRAQQPAPLIGHLDFRSPGTDEDLRAALRQGLAESGFVAGQNLVIESRFADERYERLAQLAAEVVALKPAVILATGGSAVTLAIEKATTTIPIVFTAGEDPVDVGLVASLNHPGGNATGASFFASTLTAKRLELLHEMDPGAGTVAFLAGADSPETARQVRDVEAQARTLGLKLAVVRVTGAADLEAAFTAIGQRGAGALLVSSDTTWNKVIDRIVSLAARHKIPTCYSTYETARAAGGLMSYGASRAEAYRQAGIYAGRILQGAKPSDLPVVQSSKFELFVNLSAAKALGLAVPQSILARADEVIE